MSRWAQALASRDERELMGASLDEQIGRDHGIRVLDEFLNRVDWRPWEARYKDVMVGRPPVHPRLMCGAILYGLVKRIDSTRGLEEATRMRLDFQWLLEKRTVDHTTFSKFKKRFDGEIRDLFRAINREAARLSKATIEELVLDGTRLRADSDRCGARSAASLERRLGELEERLQAQLESMEDGAEEELEGRAALEAELQRLELQREKLERALEVARQRDEAKRAKDGAKATPVRVPVSDPDASILPNKEGGYAPNYTPVVAVDSKSGMIVASEVASGGAEAASVEPLISEAREVVEGELERTLFDSAFASGRNLERLAEQDVEVYAAGEAVPCDNPAIREDGTEAVDESLRDELPKRGGKLDRSAFLYEQDKDCYYCPMGRTLNYDKTIRRTDAQGERTEVREYRSANCEGCALRAQCLSRKAKVRCVGRDQYQPLREALAARTHSPAGRKIYARRAPVVEGSFGIIKSAMGIRRFTRRGLVKVRADWQWICAAFNVRKLLMARRPHPGTATPPGMRNMPDQGLLHNLRVLPRLPRALWAESLLCNGLRQYPLVAV